jgi:hypothetical protein
MYRSNDHSDKRPGDWTCKCGRLIFGTKSKCQWCGHTRLSKNVPHSTSMYTRRNGDWKCSVCNADVFGSRIKCFKCGNPKTTRSVPYALPDVNTPTHPVVESTPHAQPVVESTPPAQPSVAPALTLSDSSNDTDIASPTSNVEVILREMTAEFRKNTAELNKQRDEIARIIRDQPVTQNIEIESNFNCVICRDASATEILLPCGHMCMCETCVRALHATNTRTCPICRHVITSSSHVFVA